MSAVSNPPKPDIGPEFHDGLSLARVGRLREARRQFARAIDRNPRHADAYYNLALTFQLEGENDKAARFYREAIATNPRYAAAWCNLGIALHADDKLKEAVAAYRGALAMDQSIPRARAYLGAVLCKEGKLEEARTLFENILAQDGADPLARFSLGRIAFEQRDFATAALLLERALEDLTISKEWLLNCAVSNSALPRHRVEDFRDALRAAVMRLSADGIEAVLMCGTLIGAMRDNEFMSFDKDIDLGIDSGVSAETLDRALREDPDFHRKTSLDEDLLPAYVFRNTVAIDFFRMFREGARTWYGLRWYGEPVKWIHRAFRVSDFRWHGVDMKIPENADFFLTECYGDWRTPNPYFASWASLNMEGGFPLIARAIAYGQIFTAAWRGERKKGRCLCEQALALDPSLGALRALRYHLHAPAQTTTLLPIVPQALGDTFDNLPG